jgi:hypothetical protein
MEDQIEIDAPLSPVARLSRDLRVAAETLSDDEARYLVDAYYAMQEQRIRTAHQERQFSGDQEPCMVISWLREQSGTLEKQVQAALDRYTRSHPTAAWLRAVKGIGPVISAGMLAHIDIHRAPTVGHIWSYAGLVSGQTWERGQKRPWNAQLKTLCWKAGESFVKVSGGDNPGYYGLIYADRKAQEVANNEAGAFTAQAAAILEKKKISKTTDAYKAYNIGKLPPAHLHARAKRYAVKRFLSDLHCVWTWIEFGRLPPRPYVVEHGGHAHIQLPPHLDILPDLRDALTAWALTRPD